MKIKTIVISVAVLGIAAVGLTVLNNNSSKPAAQPARVGTPILAADLVAKTAEIEISGKNATEKIILKKSGETWVVDSWAGLPADVSRLTTLIGGLQENKVAAFITKSAERASGLNLGNSVLTLKDSAGKVLASLEIGDTSKSNGSYIRLKGDDNVYASETSLFVDTSKDSYASKQVVTVEEKEVASVTLAPANGKAISVKRAKAEDKFGAEGLAPDEEINDAEVKTLLSNVLAARFDTLLASTDEKVTGAKDLHTVTVTTFAGASYTLKVGRKPAPPLVLAPPPEPGEKKDNPAKTPDKPKVSATITADSSGKIINTETTVKNPDGTTTTTTTIPGEPGSTTETKPSEGEKKETASTPPAPVPPEPVTPPAPPAPAEPGPVVVFYGLPNSEAAWTNAFKANTPTVPAYILDRITEAPAKLITKKPPAPAPAPVAPSPAPALPTPPAPTSVTTPPIAVPPAIPAK